MAAPKKIIAVFNEVDYAHRHFDLLTDIEMEDVKIAHACGKSMPITFYNEKMEPEFFAFIDVDDFYKDGLHVRLLVGNFLKLYKFLAVFFENVAKSMGKKRLTYCTKKRAVQTLGIQMNYRVNEYGDLERAL